MKIVFEMANNHGGDVDKGIAIIEAFAPLISEFRQFDFCFKFQYRSPSILHPTLTSKMTERIRSTMLSESDRRVLKDIAELHGYQTGCTPFDEESADMVKEHGYDFVKIASCSFTDWPLLERIATLGLPVIASTGGADLDDVARVAQFLKRRVPHLTLMHCVSIYPCKLENLGMTRIDRLKEFGCPVGFSTHEKPLSSDGSILAVAKGAEVLEWHVCYPDRANQYSLLLDETRWRLVDIADTLLACRPVINVAEDEALQQLKRGAFAKSDMKCYDKLTSDNIVFQLPAQDGQLTADDFGKYRAHSCLCDVKAGEPFILTKVDNSVDNCDLVQRMADKVQKILDASGAVLPRPAKLILSHHKGLQNFEQVGCGMVECVNGEQYAKKLIVLLPGQKHPVHWHEKKTETFNVLWGGLYLCGEYRDARGVGDQFTINPQVEHGFGSTRGCVFEEISTKLDSADSFYEELVDAVRKTEIWLP